MPERYSSKPKGGEDVKHEERKEKEKEKRNREKEKKREDGLGEGA